LTALATRRESVVGLALPGFSAAAERNAVRRFASTIGESSPIYSDLEAARQAGHPDLVVPVTYLFSLEFQRPDPYLPLRLLGIELDQILHGEQRFEYHATIHAGEELAFAPRIADYYERKQGALGFLVRRTRVDRNGELVAELENVLAVRHRPGA
jgi:hypothetical protein